MDKSATRKDTLLSLKGYGIAFDQKVILSSIDLDIPDQQTTVLLGPSATGKSTLLRTLAGFNDANPKLRTWGEANYLGTKLGQGELPALVSQSFQLLLATVLENIVYELPDRRHLTSAQQREMAQRLLYRSGLDELVSRMDEPVINLTLAQQRHLAIMRQAACNKRLICMDEPTTGLSDQEVTRLLQYITEESSRRAILIVLHNQAQARRLQGNTVLLAGGVIQAAASTERFFSEPENEVAKTFIRTGSCSLPAPDADPETLEPDSIQPPPMPTEAIKYISDSMGPRGFLWLKKGKLAGTPCPGIVHDLDYDLKALKRVGVTFLVTLTMREPEVKELEQYGIKNLWSPFADMTAPSITQAADICNKIYQAIQHGETVAVHCRAGLGRTGTILAAYLIREGNAALTALETIRRIEPRWVQSEQQVNFLDKFASVMLNRKKVSMS